MHQNRSVDRMASTEYLTAGHSVGASESDSKMGSFSQPWIQLNTGDDSQMKAYPYKRQIGMYVLSWIAILLTAGILRLIFFWREDWWVYLTASPSSVNDADIFVLENDDQQTFVRAIQQADLSVVDAKRWLRYDEVGHSVDGIPADSTTSLQCFSLPQDGGQFASVSTFRFFTHRKLTYVFHPYLATFKVLPALDKDVSCDWFHANAQPLSHAEVLQRRAVYKQNEIVVRLKPIWLLLFTEILNPFYVFQVFSVLLWYNDQYTYYASCIVLMSTISITLEIYQIRKNQKALKETVHQMDTVQVMRSGGILTLPSVALVPGDVIVIPSHGCIMQCDAALLVGNCIVNEAMLTGESVPVTKIPIPYDTAQYDLKEHSKNTLFCGTRVMQTRYYTGQNVTAVVIRSGFATMKGQLVRSIMYPKAVDFQFTKDLMKLVLVLASVAAIGFCYTIYVMYEAGYDGGKIAKRSLDIITIVVPPALPAAMTIGIMLARTRLKKEQIYCISPSVINTCGGVNVVVFDKTGTLTEDGLDFNCALPVGYSRNEFSVVPEEEVKDEPDRRSPIFGMELDNLDSVNGNYDLLVQAMASCHSLTRIDGEITGDPMDLILFEATNWSLEEPELEEASQFDTLAPTIVRPPQSWMPSPRSDSSEEKLTTGQLPRHRSPSESSAVVSGSTPLVVGEAGLARSKAPKLDEANLEIGIMRQFPFASALQRMSVIAKRLGDDDFILFSKGAPEKIASLCRKSSLPNDFSSLLQGYAMHGYRILGLAMRRVDIGFLKMQKVKREDVERDLTFLGLVVLENRLKPETAPIIDVLDKANIRTVMATGDNLLTGISVARECGMIAPDQKLYILEASLAQTLNSSEKPCVLALNAVEAIANDKMGFSNGYSPQQTPVGSPVVENAPTVPYYNYGTTRPVDAILETGVIDLGTPALTYQLAMTGASYALLSKYYPELVPKLVCQGGVFARMSPDQKAQLIGDLQEVGYIVAMCGDGANDCGALKAAHAGISLSEAEASIASPFTSKRPNIECVPTVMRQGRGALVTSFGCFKYMAAYSLCQFLSVLLLYSIGSNLSDFQFLYIDLFLITVLAVVFGYTDAAEQLSPIPPPTRILTVVTIISLGLQLLLFVIFQVFMFLFVTSQPWFVPFVDPGDADNYLSDQTTVIFLISTFEYIGLVIIYSKAHPYRKTIFNNRLLSLMVVICTSVSVVCTLYPPAFLARFLVLKMPPFFKFRVFILVLAALNFILMVLAEQIVVQWFLTDYLKLGTPQARCFPTGKSAFMAIRDELGESVAWLEKVTGRAKTSVVTQRPTNGVVDESPASPNEEHF